MPAEAKKDKGDISVADTGGKIRVYADNAEKKYWVVHEEGGKIIFPEDSGKLFYDCTKLTTVTFDQIDTGKVTNMYSMFLKCSVLTSLDLTSFNTGEVTDMGLMFWGCSALTTITASGQFITAKVGGSKNMFLNCTSLVGGQGTTYKDENPKDKTYARIDGGIPNPGYFSDKNATPPPTPPTPSVSTSPTEPAEYKPVSLETGLNGKTYTIEGTEEALNGATKIQVEKKPNGSLILHLYNEQGKEIKSKGYVFVEIPIPEGKKPPYKVTVGGKTTTFEETGRGTVAFGLLIQ